MRFAKRQPRGLALIQLTAVALAAGLLSAFRATGCEGAALAAPPADFQPSDPNTEAFLTRDFRLETFEQGAGEFLDPATLETSQMHVVDVRLRLVKMLLSTQVHEVELIDQPQFLQELDGAVDGRPVDVLVTLARKLQQRSCVQMAGGVLNGFDQDLPLAGDADATYSELLEQRAAF